MGSAVAFWATCRRLGRRQCTVVELDRIAWIVTVLACVVTALILLLEGYYGYAAVTFAVALSAFINVF